MDTLHRIRRILLHKEVRIKYTLPGTSLPQYSKHGLTSVRACSQFCRRTGSILVRTRSVLAHVAPGGVDGRRIDWSLVIGHWWPKVAVCTGSSPKITYYQRVVRTVDTNTHLPPRAQVRRYLVVLVPVLKKGHACCMYILSNI